MEIVRRHAFWFAFGAIFLALLAVEAWFTLAWRGDAKVLEKSFKLSDSKLGKMALKYNKPSIDGLKKASKAIKGENADIVDYIRQMGAERKPAVDQLFPSPPPKKADLQLGLMKDTYEDELQRLMNTLGAVDVEDEDTPAEELLKAGVFASLEESFHKPKWLEGMGLPTIVQAREGQENLWLTEDIVNAIKIVNDNFFGSKAGQGRPQTVANAPIKQLLGLRIGDGHASLKKGGGARGKRYRRATGKRARASRTRHPKTKTPQPEKVPEAESLTGHASENPLYNVLPFRLDVIADNELGGMLIRELAGGESFITIEAVSIEAVDRESIAKPRSDGLKVAKLYGSRGLVRLIIIGESLVFELPGGRVTTPPKKEKAKEGGPGGAAKSAGRAKANVLPVPQNM